jgi:hypothetical protein
MNMLDRFKGLSNAQASSNRIPPPALGKAAYLINSVRMHDNRKGGFRVEVLMSCLWGLEPGKTADGDAAGPDVSGEKVSFCLFSGDYFLKQFKEFCLTVIGKAPHEELEIADLLCPKSKFPKMDDLERVAHMWNVTLPGLVCAIDEQGRPVDAGVFDGQRVVEVGTTEKRLNKRIDPKGKDEKSNWVHDETGKPVSTVFRNSYFNKLVSMDEVAEKLSDAEKARFFGSVERFEQLRADA